MDEAEAPLLNSDSTLIGVSAYPPEDAHVPPQGGWLKPFEPGVSGNPKGRPPDDVKITRALARELGDRGGPEALARALLDYALDPDPKVRATALGAIREAYDRLEGPVTQRQDLRVQADRTIIRSGSPAHPPALPGAPDPREIEAAQLEQGRDERAT